MYKHQNQNQDIQGKCPLKPLKENTIQEMLSCFTNKIFKGNDSPLQRGVPEEQGVSLENP